MAHLDDRGIVAVIEIVVYVPLALLSIGLLFKYGFKREGWLYLLILAIVRIAGGVTHILAANQANPSATLETVVNILEMTGLSPLLIATVGFLTTVKQRAFEDGHPLNKILRLLGILSTVALVLTITGGVKIGSNATPNGDVSQINSGNNFRHIGVILFAIQFVCTVLVTFFVWAHYHLILRYRRILLKAITLSLPFLAVRVLYSVLSAYAPLGIPGVTSGSPSLANFNSTRGSFTIWVVMSPIMEFVVIVIYVSVGLATPLHNDYAVGSRGEHVEEARRLYPGTYTPNIDGTPNPDQVAKPYGNHSAFAPHPAYSRGA